MKKSLLLGLAAMALAMTFVGCQSPVNPDNVSTTTTEALPSVGNPTNVQAKAYPGAIVVSWDPVKDATKYDVYRRDNTTQFTTVKEVDVVDTAGSVTGVPYFVEKITDQNVTLVDGRNYTYVIVALSGQSTYSRAALQDDIVWNGQSSVTVTAKVPTNWNVPTIAGLKAEQVTGGDTVRVSWNAIEYNPAVDVKLEYMLGEPTDFAVSLSQSVSSDVSSTWLPLIGGKNTIFVGAQFGDGSYYATPAPASIPAEFSRDTLAAPSSFTVARRTDNKANLTWTKVSGVSNSDYKIYKAEYEGEYSSPSTTSHTALTLNLTGNWKSVSFSAPQEVDADKLMAVDSDTAALNKGYLYAIVAVKGTGEAALRSAAKLAPLDSGDITAPNPINIDVLSDYRSVRIAFANRFDNTTDYDGYNKYDSYKLYRAPVTFAAESPPATNPSTYPDEDTEPLTIGAYEDVTSKKVNDDPAWISFIDQPETRSYYRYKLEITKNGQTNTFYKNLVEAPFADSIEASISAAAGITYKTIDLTFTGFTAVKDADLSVDIYRANADTGIIENAGFTKIATGVAVSDILNSGHYSDQGNGSSTGDYDYSPAAMYTDTTPGLIDGGSYIYRFEIKKGSTVIKNREPSSTTTPTTSIVTSATTPTSSLFATDKLHFAQIGTGSTSKIRVILDKGIGISNTAGLKGATVTCVETTSSGTNSTLSPVAWDATDGLYFDLPLDKVPSVSSSTGSRSYTISITPAQVGYTGSNNPSFSVAATRSSVSGNTYNVSVTITAGTNGSSGSGSYNN